MTRIELLTALVAVLALGACGSDDDSGSPSSSGTSSGGASSGGAPSGGTGGSSTGAQGGTASGGGGTTGGTTGGGGVAGGTGGTVPCTASGPIVLNDGPTTLSNLCIDSPDKGIEGGNATAVTTLSLTNVTIKSVNYGIYCGDCQTAIFDHVDITTDPSGGDSYSVRGNFGSLTSSSSIYRASVKAFRIYGLTSGSSTGDSFEGGRLMLGGGTASEWENPAPFQNFKFTGGTIKVDSIEIYDATDHVEFDGVDFTDTGHISIQYGAHDLTFKASKNLPEIRFYDTNGPYNPDAAELAARNIVIQP